MKARPLPIARSIGTGNTISQLMQNSSPRVSSATAPGTMSDRSAAQSVRPRVLLVLAQPTQNAAPLRMMAQDARVEVLTAYCSLPGPKLFRDPEHLTRAAFDIPMLDGYAWVGLRNYSPVPR